MSQHGNVIKVSPLVTAGTPTQEAMVSVIFRGSTRGKRALDKPVKAPTTDE